MTTLRYPVASGVKCLTCGAETVSEKAHGNGFDYCEICFYTGAAYGHAREEQLNEIRKLLPDWKVTVEHTGGGCFWLAFYPPNGNGYMYAATDGEASLPSTQDADDHEQPIPNGWGCAYRYLWTDEGELSEEDEYGTEIIVAPKLNEPHTAQQSNVYWDEYPSHCLTDAQVVEAIKADWEKRP